MTWEDLEHPFCQSLASLPSYYCVGVLIGYYWLLNSWLLLCLVSSLGNGLIFMVLPCPLEGNSPSDIFWMWRRLQPLQAHPPKNLPSQPESWSLPGPCLVPAWSLESARDRVGCFLQGLAQGRLRQALGHRYSWPAHTDSAWHQL